VPHVLSRRQFIATSAVAGLGATRFASWARSAPSATVSIGKCGSYGAELVPTLDRMFDQLGGLERLVKGRTVGIKLNLTGSPQLRLGGHSAGVAHWVHPRMVGAVVHLMDRAGARRIRLLESPYASAVPLEEYMFQAGWDASDFLAPERAWSSRTRTASAAAATTTASTCRRAACCSRPTCSTTPSWTATRSSRSPSSRTT
jgi:hypothetical protein